MQSLPSGKMSQSGNEPSFTYGYHFSQSENILRSLSHLSQNRPKYATYLHFPRDARLCLTVRDPATGSVPYLCRNGLLRHVSFLFLFRGIRVLRTEFGICYVIDFYKVNAPRGIQFKKRIVIFFGPSFSVSTPYISVFQGHSEN